MSVSDAQVTTVGAEAFRGLRARFRGALLRPGEEGYDEVRRIWNGAIDRRTALTALKDRYDPTNFFRLNANVPPSDGGPR